MRHLFAVLLLAGCSAPDDAPAPECGGPDVSIELAAPAALCREQGVQCYWDNLLKLASTNSATRAINMSTPLCRMNVNVCLFALWHEIGHVKLGHTSGRAEWEDDADCFAVAHATREQTDAAICWFAAQGYEDTDVHRGSLDRAEWIRGCR